MNNIVRSLIGALGSQRRAVEVDGLPGMAEAAPFEAHYQK
jgi:hypothetical protein